ncbi:MAG: lipopolysaccharide biosynthesis protein, partial [Polynucleobacter sp.]|nr:lipopolysaccharide biosynthesis protein [Polynucleobacter sp.]
MPPNSNKIIARNTLLLYFRMLLTMGVALYTVRVVLTALGEVDYGIYNVVSGIVGLLGAMNGALISATQRFLSFELGRNDISQYTNVFSMMLIVFALLSGIVLLIAFGFGGWIIESFLVIPPERIEVAKWLFYFSAITFVVNISG